MRGVFTVVAAVSLAAGAFAGPPHDFNADFVDATLRVDLYHVGNAREELFTLDRAYRQGIWAGSRTHLLDPFGYGAYLAEIRDASSGRLLFSRGFDSYFGEYRTTAPAEAGRRRTFEESILAPYPRRKVRLVIQRRERDGRLTPVFNDEIDPAGIEVNRESPSGGVTVVPVVSHGDPHAHVDIAIVGEGYTASEEGKFRSDLRHFAKVFFAQEPYASLEDHFNVSGVLKPSTESGCDEPSRGVWKDTAVGASFDALGSERYLLTEDNRALRDIAAHVPYDAVMIMVNQARYGGGGIYNLYSVFTTDNQWSDYVFLHEFGHSFAGLADEYYTSSVAYNDFYPKGVEPDAPNITALLDPGHVKWGELVKPGTPIPTPWEKADFDAMDRAYQKVREELNGKIATAMRTGAPAAQVDELKEEAEQLSREHAEKVDAYLAKSAWTGVVGAFQGAGYASEGLYRPMLDCIMFTKGVKPFCAVCQRAIADVIRTYGE
jgi:hypothetical protein